MKDRCSKQRLSRLMEDITPHISKIQEIVNDEEAMCNNGVLDMIKIIHIAAEYLNGNINEREYNEAMDDYISGNYVIDDETV